MHTTARTAALAAAGIACALAGEAGAGWSRQRSGMQEDKAMIALDAADATHVYAAGFTNIGGSDKGIILFTADGGATWNQAMPDGRPIAIYASAFAPSPVKCYVGGMGKVFVTTNGGTDWTESASPDMRLQVVMGIGGAGDFFAVATAGSKILVTNDGGASWTPATSPLGEAELGAVTFVDGQNGWITAGGADYNEEDKLTGYSGGAVLVTRDSGTTWTAARQGEAKEYRKACFISPLEGWVVSNSMTGPALEKSVDGGQTWQAMTLPAFSGGTLKALSQVHFFDRCEGFLLGSDDDAKKTALFSTTDGGKSWTQQDTSWAKVEMPFPFPVFSLLFLMDFAGRDRGWVSGSYEFIGTYQADTAAPACDVPPPADSGRDGSSADGGEGYYESGSGGCGCRLTT